MAHILAQTGGRLSVKHGDGRQARRSDVPTDQLGLQLEAVIAETCLDRALVRLLGDSTKRTLPVVNAVP